MSYGKKPLFFKSTKPKSKHIYLFFTGEKTVEQVETIMAELFPFSEKITMNEFDFLAESGSEVIFVGDDRVIDNLNQYDEEIQDIEITEEKKENTKTIGSGDSPKSRSDI